MTLLNELEDMMVNLHEVKIEPVSDYWKDENKTRAVKELYSIVIEHEDHPAGIYFSPYASFYRKKIDALLRELYGDKIYTVCTSECDTRLEFRVAYYKDRQARVSNF